MDFFPNRVVETVDPLNLPDKAEVMVDLAKRGEITAFIAYQEKKYKRVFHREEKRWTETQVHLDNFKRCFQAARICNQVQLNKVRWDRISNRLLKEVVDKRKNSDTRLCFLHKNLFLVKAYFTFGLRHVHAQTQHVLQLSEAPLLCYVMDPDDQDSYKAIQCFVAVDEFRYQKFILNPNRTYVIPPSTSYVLMSIQKTAFTLDIISAQVQVKEGLMCTTHRKFIQPDLYALPPPTAIHEMKAPERTPQEPVKELFPPPETVPPETVPVQIFYVPTETFCVPPQTVPSETFCVPPQTVPSETFCVPPQTISVPPVPSDNLSMPSLECIDSNVIGEDVWDDIHDFLKGLEHSFPPSEPPSLASQLTEGDDTNSLATTDSETPQSCELQPPEYIPLPTDKPLDATEPETFIPQSCELQPPECIQPLDLSPCTRTQMGVKRTMGFEPIYAMDLSVKRAKCC